jgi:hypothetical protein
MTFAPFSQEGRGAGWEVGENFRGKKPLSPLPSALFQAEIGAEQGYAQFLADKIAALGGEPTTEPRPVPHSPPLASA